MPSCLLTDLLIYVMWGFMIRGIYFRREETTHLQIFQGTSILCFNLWEICDINMTWKAFIHVTKLNICREFGTLNSCQTSSFNCGIWGKWFPLSLSPHPGVKNRRVEILILPLASCLTLSQLLHLSEPPFHHLWNEDNKRIRDYCGDKWEKPRYMLCMLSSNWRNKC